MPCAASIACHCECALTSLHRARRSITLCSRSAPLRALANMRRNAIVVQTTDPAALAAASSRQRTR
ncbi:hypothetical protein BZM27_47320 [Paraburkholderia steynii]|uniref:Uncharacterized protein n=1 Tax=Paraburkholderia steynii TaxID=1245441 RepID=A0A4R0X0Q7_9BURK|nr:hypothetical protein BZM27_47320 [Paraburkholderia steynii]